MYSYKGPTWVQELRLHIPLCKGLSVLLRFSLRQGWATASEYARVRPSTHEYARVRTSTPEYARVRPSMHEYARVRTSTPEYARVRPSTHEYARVRTSTPEYARVRTSTPEYARVRPSTPSTPEYARVRSSTPEYPRLRTSTHEYARLRTSTHEFVSKHVHTLLEIHHAKVVFAKCGGRGGGWGLPNPRFIFSRASLLQRICIHFRLIFGNPSCEHRVCKWGGSPPPNPPRSF